MSNAPHEAPLPTTQIAMSGWPLTRVAEFMDARGLSAVHARAWFTAVQRRFDLDLHTLDSTRDTLSPRLMPLLATLPRGDDLKIERVERAIDGTVKLLIATPDARLIETVIIPAGQRRTLCVSSQVGCAIGCPFCYTARLGLTRNLESWEIVAQLRMAMLHSDRPITNVVFMGMGEPLANADAVGDACAVLGDDQGFGLPARHLVVSTSGIAPAMRRFAERGVGVLALSLHSARDEVRDVLVPLNRRWNVAALKQTIADLPLGARGSVTIEVAMMRGVNDSQLDADALVAFCDGLAVKVNLIELNSFPGSEYSKSAPAVVESFRARLSAAGIVATIRRSRGADILAACGQLAAASKHLSVLPRG